MSILVQLLCGKINLYDTMGGLEVLRPHRLQIEPGVCAHTNPAAWEERTAGIEGAYAGTVGDAEWPVHVWTDATVSRREPATPNSPELIAARAAGFPRREPVREAPDALPPLHCYPLRGEWERVKPRERSQHPEPQVRGAWGVEMPERCPDPVLKLAELAREASWEVRVSYARGNGVHGATGRPTALRHSIAIAFGRHPLTDAQAVATYVRPVAGSGTWSWESVWLWGPGLPHFGLCSLADLKEWLASGGVLDYAAVRARVEGAAAAREALEEKRKLIKKDFKAGKSAEVLARREGLSVEDVLKIVVPASKREAVAGR